LFLAGKNVVFSLRKSADLVCIVRQWCIPFTTSGARNSVRSICPGWPGSFSLLNRLTVSRIRIPPISSSVPDPRIRTFDWRIRILLLSSVTFETPTKINFLLWVYA
jgi:hypothetical protein